MTVVLSRMRSRPLAETAEQLLIAAHIICRAGIKREKEIRLNHVGRCLRPSQADFLLNGGPGVQIVRQVFSVRLF